VKYSRQSNAVVIISASRCPGATTGWTTGEQRVAGVLRARREESSRIQSPSGDAMLGQLLDYLRRSVP
jgi:hypothetical protein